VILEGSMLLKLAVATRLCYENDLVMQHDFVSARFQAAALSVVSSLIILHVLTSCYWKCVCVCVLLSVTGKPQV
jgi:hypothetical protein